ncbi:MAG: hypothetical protein L6R41_001059 [Letrouitia leprolyta]|nr:MAG: hypothetical protein L6R41_001059 [Letrouitia leprolyta]
MDSSNGYTSALKLLSLPDELLVDVLSYIDKAKLKEIRRLCKRLARCAIPSLFTTAVVSGFGTDMEVLQAIVKRQDFARSVRTLVYDVQSFEKSRLDRPHLERQIYRDLGNRNDSYNAWEENYDIVHFSLLGESSEDPKPHWEYVTNTHLEKKGEDIWKHQLDKQLDRTDQTFLNIVVKGLAAFPSLTTIVVQGYWKKVEAFNLMETADGVQFDHMFYYSPLARQWNPLWLRPRMVRENRQVDDMLRPLFSTLQKTDHIIRHLDLGNSRTIYRVRKAYPHSTFFALPMEWIPQYLTSLRVEFDESIDVYDKAYKENFCGLIPKIQTLEKLDITYQRPWREVSDWFREFNDDERAFYLDLSSAIMASLSDPSVYPLLHTLALTGIGSSSDQLLDTLKGYQNLNSLYICDVYMHEGSWPELFDGLKDSSKLDEFGLDRGKIDRVRVFGDVAIQGLNNLVELYVTGEHDDPLEDLPLEGVRHWWANVGVLELDTYWKEVEDGYWDYVLPEQGWQWEC